MSKLITVKTVIRISNVVISITSFLNISVQSRRNPPRYVLSKRSNRPPFYGNARYEITIYRDELPVLRAPKSSSHSTISGQLLPLFLILQNVFKGKSGICFHPLIYGCLLLILGERNPFWKHFTYLSCKLPLIECGVHYRKIRPSDRNVSFQ